MPHPTVRHLLFLAAVVAVTLAGGSVHGQGDADRVRALIRDLKNADFEKASAAASELRNHRHHHRQVVAGLIDAIRTGDWDRCGGDMRDTVAHELEELKAKEAVVPLLELVKSGKSIEHECAE